MCSHLEDSNDRNNNNDNNDTEMLNAPPALPLCCALCPLHSLKEDLSASCCGLKVCVPQMQMVKPYPFMGWHLKTGPLILRSRGWGPHGKIPYEEREKREKARSLLTHPPRNTQKSSKKAANGKPGRGLSPEPERTWTGSWTPASRSVR